MYRHNIEVYFLIDIDARIMYKIIFITVFQTVNVVCQRPSFTIIALIGSTISIIRKLSCWRPIALPPILDGKSLVSKRHCNLKAFLNWIWPEVIMICEMMLKRWNGSERNSIFPTSFWCIFANEFLICKFCVKNLS